MSESGADVHASPGRNREVKGISHWQLDFYRDGVRHGAPRCARGTPVDVAAYAKIFAIFSTVVVVTKLETPSVEICASSPTVDALYHTAPETHRRRALERLYGEEERMWDTEVTRRREAHRKEQEIVATQERERLLAIERKKHEEARRDVERQVEAKRRADEEMQLQERKEAEAVAAQAEEKRLAAAQVRQAAYEAQWRAQELEQLRYVTTSPHERKTYEFEREAEEEEQRRLWEVRTRQTHHEREYETWRFRVLHEPEAYES